MAGQSGEPERKVCLVCHNDARARRGHGHGHCTPWGSCRGKRLRPLLRLSTVFLLVTQRQSNGGVCKKAEEEVEEREVKEEEGEEEPTGRESLSFVFLGHK